MTGIEQDGARSIGKTHASLGVVKSFLPTSCPRPAVAPPGREKVEEG